MLARPLNSLQFPRRTVPVPPNAIVPIDWKYHERRASKEKLFDNRMSEIARSQVPSDSSLLLPPTPDIDTQIATTM